MVVSDALGDWLSYLQDLGWDEVYARRVAPVAGDVRAAEGSPEREAEAVPQKGLQERARALAELAESIRDCRRCALCEGRRQVVFGSGTVDAEIMFVGEGPGAQEDLQGLPFVGPAGELLTRIVQAIGRERAGVYIANIVKCRPPRNRDPHPDEVAACRGYLEAQIALVRPRVLVALGRVAAQSLLGNDLSVGRLRGRWHDFRGTPVRVTYHPAALLRNTQYKRPTWEDMKAVRDLLDSGGSRD